MVGPRVRMDCDPELDVTLSNGRRVVTFQIAALDQDLGTWTVVDPLVPRRVILGAADALAMRRHLDARIAARLAAGWVPVDAGPADMPAVPLPSDLQVQLGSLLCAVTGARGALRAADPSGQLWAACVTFAQQARRFGVPVPATRLAHAQRERRLGERAAQAGDVAGAIVHYRAALAAHARVGVRRRLASLERATPAALPGPVRHARIGCRQIGPRRAAHAGPQSRATPPRGSIQLACRIDLPLHATVRAQAARAGQTLRTFVVCALQQALTRSSRRP